MPTRAASRRRSSPRPTVHNRRWWDRTSDWYDGRHRTTLTVHGARAWGFWRIPEDRAHWLGPVRGKDVLELGCGAARWSIALRRLGARAVGLDQSASQLRKARSLASEERHPLPIVRADAERLPFRNRSFDLVFCDWGAMTFADPRRTVPECARVLRRGGHLVFATGTWFGLVTWDAKRDRLTRRLSRPYFGPIGRRVGEMFEFRPGTGEWIDLFRVNGFVVERMSETQAPPRGASSYLPASDTAWARKWPIEVIWRVRRV